MGKNRWFLPLTATLGTTGGNTYSSLCSDVT